MTLEQAIAYAMAAAEPSRATAEPAITATPHIAADTKPPSPLSPREQEVVRLVAQDLTNREIAERLVITERTAANHIEHILTKLGLRSRLQIALWAKEHGLGTPASG